MSKIQLGANPLSQKDLLKKRLRILRRRMRRLRSMEREAYISVMDRLHILNP